MMARYRGWGLLVALMIAGSALLLWDGTDRVRLMAWGEKLAALPATPVVLVMLQAALFTIAAPGSLTLWLVAPFYSPLKATVILVVGAVAGGLGAYALADRLSGRVKPRLLHRPTFRILTRHSDFWTQCALRVLPGFPHAVINYGSGILHVPLGSFTVAAICGLTIKMSVYTAAIHAMVQAEEWGEVLRPFTLLALILLAIFLVSGSWGARRMRARCS